MSPFSKHSSAQETETAPKRLKQAFFKGVSSDDSYDETLENTGQLSLRSYIKERLKEEAEGGPKGTVINDSPTFNIQKAPSSQAFISDKAAFSQSFGEQIYGLDTELSSGIEQYLPTPAVRFRVIKERLNGEISTLEAQLENYQAIQKPSLQLVEKIGRLQAKLGTLRNHESKVDAELKALFGQSSSFFHVATTFQDLKNDFDKSAEILLHELSAEKMIHRLDPVRAEMDTLNVRLKDLTEILQEQMKRRSIDEAEISDVINEYDKTLKRVDVLSEQLSSRKGWLEKMNDQINQAYQSMYS